MYVFQTYKEIKKSDQLMTTVIGYAIVYAFRKIRIKMREDQPPLNSWNDLFPL